MPIQLQPSASTSTSSSLGHGPSHGVRYPYGYSHGPYPPYSDYYSNSNSLNPTPNATTRPSSPTKLSATSSSGTGSTHGILSSLQSLIPRHAVFHACVQIHEITGVPLTEGEFAVRWKVKNTTHFQGKDKDKEREGGEGGEGGSSKGGLFRLGSKRKENRRSLDATLEQQGQPDVDEMGELQDDGRRRSTSSSRSHLSNYTTPMPIPPLLNPNSNNTNPPSNKSTSTSISSTTSSGHGGHFTSSGQYLCGCGAEQQEPSQCSTLPRGITPFLKLKEHSVEWQQTLHEYIKLPIGRGAIPASALPKEERERLAAQRQRRRSREKGKMKQSNGSTTSLNGGGGGRNPYSDFDVVSPTDDSEYTDSDDDDEERIEWIDNLLQPTTLKLVVMQRVDQGYKGGPRNPRMGVLYLNLAEYAGVGVNGGSGKGQGRGVTRRYLLRESKTNATLKVRCLFYILLVLYPIRL
jgi:hypothetical protein